MSLDNTLAITVAVVGFGVWRKKYRRLPAGVQAGID